jgi:Protein of unknown function (DUF2934)
MTKTRESSSPAVKKSVGKQSTPPTHEDIALRAYQIYLERGGQPGNEVKDWILAERELMEKNGRELTEQNGNGRAKVRARAKAASL